MIRNKLMRENGERNNINSLHNLKFAKEDYV